MKDATIIQAILDEEEYATGFYTMVWLDKDDVVHEMEFDSKEKMYDAYSEEWADGGWGFDFYDPNGHKFFLKKP